MYRKHNQRDKGFTIIELMLAMTFFSAVLVLGAAAFVQMLGIYNKGVAVKQMNEVGRTLTDGIIRSANQNVSEIKIAPGAPADPRCLKLGSAVYLWSYAKDFDGGPSLASAYKYNASEPINFVRHNTADDCPLAGSVVLRSEVSPLVGDTVRVYLAEVTNLGGPNDGLLNLRLVLGTYAGLNAGSNVVINAGEPSCATDSIGNFCAFGTYETTIFLANGS